MNARARKWARENKETMVSYKMNKYWSDPAYRQQQIEKARAYRAARRLQPESVQEE